MVGNKGRLQLERKQVSECMTIVGKMADRMDPRHCGMVELRWR